MVDLLGKQRRCEQSFPADGCKFDNGRGVFYAYEPVAGQHIHTRTVYTTLSKDAARWEQAFSTDGGQSWETNWICDFTREEIANPG